MEIAIDFDGTCVTHAFPFVGNDIGAAPVLKALISKGHKLILYTMRCDDITSTEKVEGIHNINGPFLTDAVNWFKKNDITLYGIQTNPRQSKWTTSPKCYAHLIIDDTALGIPLKWDSTLSDRAYVDWRRVELLLKERNIL